MKGDLPRLTRPRLPPPSVSRPLFAIPSVPRNRGIWIPLVAPNQAREKFRGAQEQDPGGEKSCGGRTYLPRAPVGRVERAPQVAGRAGRSLRGSLARCRSRAGEGRMAQNRANRRQLRLPGAGQADRQPLLMRRGRWPGRWLWGRLGQGGGRAKRSLRPGPGPKGLGHGLARSPLSPPTLFFLSLGRWGRMSPPSQPPPHLRSLENVSLSLFQRRARAWEGGSKWVYPHGFSPPP